MPLANDNALLKSLYLMPVNNVNPCNIMDEEHATRVGLLCYSMALQLGYEVRMAEQIQIAGFYHDIGKIFIPDEILSKTSSLTKEEFKQIYLHTEYGYALLSSQETALFTMVAQVALDHHERLDGSGYQRKTEKEINDVAKIVMVADVYDALISERCYKPAYTIEKTQYIIEKEMKGKLFPEYVNVLKSVLADDGNIR